MALWFSGKEKRKSSPPCVCGGTVSEAGTAAGRGRRENDRPAASVKVLGSGCASCRALYERVSAVAAEMGLPDRPESITDIEEVMKYGVMSLPALVVNEEVVSAGKVLKPDEIRRLLRGAAGKS